MRQRPFARPHLLPFLADALAATALPVRLSCIKEDSR